MMMDGTSSNTNSIQPQEVWLAEFPYEDDPSIKKLRPVIVLSQTDEGVTVAGLKEDSFLSVKVTSHNPRTKDSFDTIIVKWKEANLDKESVARISKTMNLPASQFKRKLGDADENDFENILTKYLEFIEQNE
jgi:mRNA-degrading endonuclease toxin of MazEF toxin-antitoxin module